jgi:hypothetical protein
MTTHFTGLTNSAAAHHLCGLRRIVGDRQHVDAERGEPSDRKPDHHVVVDA